MCEPPNQILEFLAKLLGTKITALCAEYYSKRGTPSTPYYSKPPNQILEPGYIGITTGSLAPLPPSQPLISFYGYAFITRFLVRKPSSGPKQRGVLAT
jgi:hypothetical protein